jgi:hypothetical protein
MKAIKSQATDTKDIKQIIADKEKELNDLLIEKQKETHAAIKKLADESGYYCGVILDKENLLSILKLALESGDSVRIPFNLYNKQ